MLNFLDSNQILEFCTGAKISSALVNLKYNTALQKASLYYVKIPRSCFSDTSLATRSL